MSTIGPFVVRRVRQGGEVAEITPRFADPGEAVTAARLLREAGDPTAHVELVHADELEAELAARTGA